MNYSDKKVTGINIAYIGGGSRNWAWSLMRDLALSKDISGNVNLYDIDYDAALDNQQIGNNIASENPDASVWTYNAHQTIDTALKDADFVIISILPGTFAQMQSDVHTPEEYGIYQSVGDTTGPGGIIRALRTIPMYEKIALKIKEICPNAWVINYTNPMTICTNTLYKVFPEIKAFGCCHEVFSTQRILAAALNKVLGIENISRKDIKTEVTGINHFTWITKATYHSIDLFEVYDKYIDMQSWNNDPEAGRKKFFFDSCEWVKFDLFKRFGYIAAAGDRHLSEFCPKDWYLKNPDHVSSWGFSLTPVSWRINDLSWRKEQSRLYLSKEKPFELYPSGEEGADQIRAILGLNDLVTNVNLPNRGQIPNLPSGAVVETNAVFRDNSVTPVFAGEIPQNIYNLIFNTVQIQQEVIQAALNRDLKAAYEAFKKDNLVKHLSEKDSKDLFDKMVDNTKEYLKEYF